MYIETGHLFSDLRALIESDLNQRTGRETWNPAVRYALFSGGRRMRPLLCLLAAKACGAPVRDAVPAACGVELLHTASLILDDMPCMDNSAERRGSPSVHVQFGEASAALAVVALLNQAFGIFSSGPPLAAEAQACLAEMIEGQAADLLHLGTEGGSEQSLRKSTGLLRLTLTAGALACKASEQDVRVLAQCGEAIGRAYQMYDDVEDGDAASSMGADELVEEAKRTLHDRFEDQSVPLLAAIELMFHHFADKRLVSA